MKAVLNEKPRIFSVNSITISDWGRIHLEPNEMITFVSPNGKECDFTATDWGYYLASSLNGRMRREGFKIALVKNPSGKLFLNAVSESKLSIFEEYLKSQSSEIIMWLDEYGE